jgi:putative membrane protein
VKVDSWKEAWKEGPGPHSKVEYIILTLKGFLMGIADLIPGVSGGTIAFITGIYETLLDAVASIDKEFFSHILRLDFKSALGHIHLRFLVPLVGGIAIAMLSLARLMHYLMNNHPIPTWAMFFGLILASTLIIWKQLEEHFRLSNLAIITVGAIFAWVVVSLIPVETPEATWFIFLCGFISIMAMILPGISGSFLMLILGKYEYITGALKNPFADGSLTIIIVFVMGALSGLLSFSKLLNYFMKHHHQKTMAFLTGVLIGSMKKVWPWREVLESKIIRGKVKILREANIMPSAFDGETMLAIGLIIVGFIAVLVLESKASKVNNTVEA